MEKAGDSLEAALSNRNYTSLRQSEPRSFTFPSGYYDVTTAPEVLTHIDAQGIWTCTCQEFAMNSWRTPAYCYHIIVARDGLAAKFKPTPIGAAEYPEPAGRKFDL